MSIEDKFHIHGFTLDYYVERKFIGSTKVDESDRDTYGYAGRKIEILSNDVICTNNKRIKAGTEVITECSPICGRAKEPLVWRIDATMYDNKALLQLLKANNQFSKFLAEGKSWTDVELLISAKLKLKCTEKQYEYIQNYYTKKTK